MTYELDATTTRRVAISEAAQAVLAVLDGGAPALVTVTIVPTAHALGYARFKPCDTVALLRGHDVRKRIVMCLAGEAAEAKLVEEPAAHTGHSHSFEQAGHLARRYLETTEGHSLSPRELDNQVLQLLSECRAEAHAMVGREADRISTVADALVAERTLSGQRVAELLAA